MSSKTLRENKKYLNLIHTARELFFKHGLKRVTLEEICDKADVSRVTFYKYFRNKDELAVKIFKQIMDTLLAELSEIIHKDIPFTRKIKQVINYEFKIIDAWGSIFFEDLIKFVEGEEALFTSYKKDLQNMINLFITQGQEEGVIRESLNPALILLFRDFLRPMFYDERMKSIVPDQRDRVEQIVNLFMYGIIDSRFHESEPHKH
jgi:AcrR family transcriptional regulator